MQRARNAAADGAKTGLRLVEKPGADNPSTVGKYIPMRKPVLCACGCGECFVPTCNTQRYVDAKHRRARFVEDKKDATFDFVQAALLSCGVPTKTAARVAQNGVDFFFSAWCKALVKRGYRYDTKECCWLRETRNVL